MTVSKVGAPLNDRCDEAERLVLNTPMLGSTKLATSDDNFPPCEQSKSSDVFYVFAAPLPGLYLFSVCNDAYSQNRDYWGFVSLFEGTCDAPQCTRQTTLSCTQSRPGGIAVKELNVGQEIYIAVHGNGSRLGSDGDFIITASLYESPLGINCEVPIEIGTREEKQGMTLYLGNDTNNRCGSWRYPHLSTFYKLKERRTGWYRVNFTSSYGANHRMDITRNCSGESYGELCFAEVQKESHLYLFHEEEPVFIVLSSENDSAYGGTFNLSVSDFRPISPNFECSAAIPLRLNDPVKADTHFAAGLNFPFYQGCTPWHVDPTPGLYYKFKASRSTIYEIRWDVPFSYSESRSTFICSFGVMRGPCEDPVSDSCTSYQEQIRLYLDNEEEVTIFIATRVPNIATLTVTDLLPDNLYCSEAIPLQLGEKAGISAADSQKIFVDDHFPVCRSDFSNRGSPLYYSFRVPETGVYSIFGSTELNFELFTGSCDNPACILINDDQHNALTFEVEKNQTITIVPYHFASEYSFTHSYEGSFHIERAIPPQNFQCANATEIFLHESQMSETKNASSNHSQYPTCAQQHNAPVGYSNPPMVFYRFVAPFSGTYSFRINSQLTGWIGIYRDCNRPGQSIVEQSCPGSGKGNQKALRVHLYEHDEIVVSVQLHHSFYENQRSGAFRLSVNLQSSDNGKHKDHTGVIVGSVLGGTFGLVLIVVVGYFAICALRGSDEDDVPVVHRMVVPCDNQEEEEEDQTGSLTGEIIDDGDSSFPFTQEDLD